MLSAAVRRICPEAPISIANDPASLKRCLSGKFLLLINRVIDGDFESTSGVRLIEELSQMSDPPLMMLISNYPEAQNEAVAAGAIRGFGKAQLYLENTASILRGAIACEPIH